MNNITRSYGFRYKHGQSAPFATLEAASDLDFFQTVLPAWERKTGFKYLVGSVTCTMSETRKVPEPTTARPGPKNPIAGDVLRIEL